MKRKLVFPLLLLLLSVPVSSCAGLIPLDDEEPATGTFGPQMTLQEHHAQTLEALWTILQENYIYYDTANVDWTALKGKYQAEIQRGLTAEEFDQLLRRLEDDLPESSLLYQSRRERVETDITDNSTYEGIGAFVGFDPNPQPHIILLAIIDGSPAEKAGLKAHESILAIDGKPVLLEEGINAVQRVRGPAGSTVTLTVQAPGGAKREVEVQRGRLTANVRLEAGQIVGTSYGYLLFPPVPYDNLLNDVVAAMETLTTNQKLEGLILDLRIAGSSGSFPLDTLYSLFHNGELGEFYNRTDEQMIEIPGENVFDSQNVPLVVLVGKHTQGFPEILAGSLQMHERAVIIGEPTTGAVETSTVFLLPDGSRVYIETTSFILPNGREIGITGILPDIPIETGWDEILPGKDPSLDAAIVYFRTRE
ncbi:MAG: PDZ domain-containing protein [Chloroflexi bacterium]|nr:PDZ domain-containing protein [Chloroflexota bacterium]